MNEQETHLSVSYCASVRLHSVWQCVRFLIQGLTPQKAIRGAIVVPLDSPPLVCSKAVGFVFLSQGVWLLWAFIFFPLGNYEQSNWIFRAFMTAKLVSLDCPPLAFYNHCVSVFLSQSVWPSIACLCSLWGSTSKIGLWEAGKGWQKWYHFIASLWIAKTPKIMWLSKTIFELFHCVISCHTYYTHIHTRKIWIALCRS